MAPDLIIVLRRNLRDAFRRNRLGDAEDLLSRLKEVDPLSAGTRGMQLELLVRKGRLAEAAKLAPQLVKQFPDSAGVQHWSGRAAYKQKKYDEAERLLRESLRLADHWITQWWLGKTLTQIGRFGEAERTLTPLAEGHPVCRKDLAWLYERMEEPQRALDEIDRFLEQQPGDAFASEQRTRLLSRLVDDEELLAEVEALRDLGEQVPEQMAPRYLGALLESGQGAQARKLVGEMLPGLDPRLAVRLGWQAYKALEYDLAYDLWLVGLPFNLDNLKLLNSLGKAARVCCREELLAEALEQYAPQQPKLYGRIKKLKREVSAEPTRKRRESEKADPSS